jgi:hypothetical protein
MVLDVNEVYHDKKEGINVGLKREQDAIYDLKRGKKLILDPSAPTRGTLVKLTGEETDEELDRIADLMYRALLPEMSDDGQQ